MFHHWYRTTTAGAGPRSFERHPAAATTTSQARLFCGHPITPAACEWPVPDPRSCEWFDLWHTYIVHLYLYSCGRGQTRSRRIYGDQLLRPCARRRPSLHLLCRCRQCSGRLRRKSVSSVICGQCSAGCERCSPLAVRVARIVQRMSGDWSACERIFSRLFPHNLPDCHTTGASEHQEARVHS